eukprot:CAMPEP_0194301634 /NCGR_PEP_ID=MMETSP0169-20130528/61903_1 /TAXON_ID=218684 /ORGANISM="Corethron pennatum, Strain L29A3" /LENGTH=235 /DNA_ID=CAMNT_0039051897 /DNA_START=192 /DNA_END=899 /DNA_ORIENTATION=+
MARPTITPPSWFAPWMRIHRGLPPYDPDTSGRGGAGVTRSASQHPLFFEELSQGHHLPTGHEEQHDPLQQRPPDHPRPNVFAQFPVGALPRPHERLVVGDRLQPAEQLRHVRDDLVGQQVAGCARRVLHEGRRPQGEPHVVVGPGAVVGGGLVGEAQLVPAGALHAETSFGRAVVGAPHRRPVGIAELRAERLGTLLVVEQVEVAGDDRVGGGVRAEADGFTAVDFELDRAGGGV